MLITPRRRGARRISAGSGLARPGPLGLCRAALVAFLLWLAGTVPAAGFETVLGGGNAKACMTAARIAADRHEIEPRAIELCTLAILADGLSARDLAATHVNRGIIALCRGDTAAAEADFDAAIAIVPELAGAHMNRGAVLVAEHRPQEAIAALDRSLALGTPEPERALFDRALAREQTGDVAGAYWDLQKAAQLNPRWDAPVKELTYFTVTHKPDAP